MGIPLSQKLKALDARFANDADFKQTFLDYVRRAYIASLYQDENDVDVIIEIYARKIATLLYNKNFLKKKDKSEFTPKLTKFLKKHLNEKVVFDYFSTQIIPKNFSFDVQNILDAIDKIYKEIYNEISSSVSQNLIDNICSIQQLRRDYFAALTRADWKDLKRDRWFTTSFFFLNVAIFYSNWNEEIYTYTHDARLIYLWFAFSTAMHTYLGYKSSSVVTFVNDIVKKSEQNILAFFNLENFITELKQEEDRQAATTNVSTRGLFTAPPFLGSTTPNGNTANNNKDNNSAKDDDNNNTARSKTKTRANHVTMFYNKVKKIVSPEETVITWQIQHQDQILKYSIPKNMTLVLNKGTLYTNLVEGTKLIFLDEDAVEKNHLPDFKAIYDKATFHEETTHSNCVHFMNHIWSLKSKNKYTKDSRIVGTEVATTADDRKLIVFCQELDHVTLAKKMRNLPEFKAELTLLAIKALEKTPTAVSNENNTARPNM